MTVYLCIVKGAMLSFWRKLADADADAFAFLNRYLSGPQTEPCMTQRSSTTVNSLARFKDQVKVAITYSPKSGLLSLNPRRDYFQFFDERLLRQTQMSLSLNYGESVKEGRGCRVRNGHLRSLWANLQFVRLCFILAERFGQNNTSLLLLAS